MEEEVERLKKRLRFRSIVIGILSFITLATFVYCYVRIKKANEELALAHNYEQIASRTSELEQCKQDLFKASMIAQKSAEEALKQQKLAEANAAEAMKQHQIAEEALKKDFKEMNYNVHPGQGTEVPILISVPHCGTDFPDELKDQYKTNLIASPDDTDWFVHQLYDFAPSMGMTLIAAKYSRWVIDLNRDPQSKPLYTDGRIITSLCPTTTFLGEPLYRDERKEINPNEISRRLETYYWPYHQQIEAQIVRLKKKFGKVLLWDCHSIRQVVPTIQKEKFPDLILGDADSTSASPGLIETTLGVLDHGTYSVNHNHPFKGGFITRYFGKPSENVHALQLEMTKVNYMDDSETTYHRERASKMRMLLKKNFDLLIEQLS